MFSDSLFLALIFISSTFLRFILLLWFLQYGPGTSSGAPRHFQRIHEVKAIFTILRLYLPFFTLMLSQVYSVVFQRLNDMWHKSKLNIKEDMNIHLSFIKLDSNKICRNAKQCHTSHYIVFWFWKIQSFFKKNMLFVIIHISLLFLINWSFKNS